MKIAVTEFCADHHTNPESGATLLSPEQIAAVCEYANVHTDDLKEGDESHVRTLMIHPAQVGGDLITVPFMPITDENRHLLQSGYVMRRDGELPFLMRWFEGDDVNGTSKVESLLVICYTADALAKEGVEIDGDFGIVTILGLREGFEGRAAMVPATVLRNALGEKYGGTPSDDEGGFSEANYREGVEFYEKHATIRNTRC